LRTHAKRIRGIVEIFDKLAYAVKNELDQNRFPVVISGDHSSAGATIAGVKMAYPNKRIGVVWVDAHADLHTPFTTPSGNVHGMPLATALGLGNIRNSVNDVNGDVPEYWNYLLNVGNIKPKIKAEDIVFIGLRDYEDAERTYIEKNNVKVITVSELRERKAKIIASETLKYLSHCDYIYVSFDVDSIDSSIIKGTGTPVPNGLTINEVDVLLKNLVKSDKVACFEITEINPLLDNKNETAIKVFPVFRNTVNTIKDFLQKQDKQRKKELKALELKSKISTL
jgi:arginase